MFQRLARRLGTTAARVRRPLITAVEGFALCVLGLGFSRAGVLDFGSKPGTLNPLPPRVSRLRNVCLNPKP